MIEFWSNQWVNGTQFLNMAELFCYFQSSQFGQVRNHPNWSYLNRESLVSSVKDCDQLSHHSKPSMSLWVRLDQMGELSLVGLWIALTLGMSKNLNTAWPILLCASFSCSKLKRWQNRDRFCLPILISAWCVCIYIYKLFLYRI